MYKSLPFILIVLLTLAFSVQAQNSRLLELTRQSEKNINDLANRSPREFLNRSGSNKDELENLVIAQQLKATINVFILLAENNRPVSELRDVAESLNNLARRAATNASNGTQWQQIKQDIDELLREVRGNSTSQNNENDKNKGVLGKLIWQGSIDDEVHLVIKGNSIQIRTISGTEYKDGIFSFTAPLPDENVRVFVNKKEGRGQVKVIQMPTSDNDFTAIIQVLDKNGGARQYDLEIFWTK